MATEFEILRIKPAPDYTPYLDSLNVSETLVADGPKAAAEKAQAQDGELIFVRFPPGGGITAWRVTRPTRNVAAPVDLTTL